jgi:hypothetical protein
MVYLRFAPSYKKEFIVNSFIHSSGVEPGSNTSTAALQVVGGDEKGSLESETVKYDHESHGTRTREWLRWRGPAAILNDCRLKKLPPFPTKCSLGTPELELLFSTELFFIATLHGRNRKHRFQQPYCCVFTDQLLRNGFREYSLPWEYVNRSVA